MTHRVGQGRHLTDAVGHRRDAGLGQRQTIQHHRGNGGPCRLHILCVSGENRSGIVNKRLRHSGEGAILLFGGEGGQGGGGRLGTQENVAGGHRATPFARKRVPTDLPSTISYKTEGS